jgi:photosystem II stability/assembly factor-like uncharacterized protein
MHRILVVVLIFAAPQGVLAQWQWEMQESHSSADLRGIHAVSSMVAWASGTNGTILRTTDGGATWQKCAVPPEGDKLDFRGIWAWDANNAMAMSAGPGDLSRIYKTTDGCQHWTEEMKNTDKDGFWDALVFQAQDYGLLGDLKTGVLIGDPVKGRFETNVMVLGRGWFIDTDSCVARPSEAAFAASNSSVVVFGSRRYILGTGGKGGPRVLLSPLLGHGAPAKDCIEASVPLASGSDSTGVFSLAFRDLKHGVAVGGDYKKPNDPTGTAARTSDGGRHWAIAARMPHGYRSAVAFNIEAAQWIAVGTNGSDLSFDDGQTWRPLDNSEWNALSLPFAVGPKGRIGKLGKLGK